MSYNYEDPEFFEDDDDFSNESYNELDDLEDYYTGYDSDYGDYEPDYYEEEDYYDFPENWNEM